MYYNPVKVVETNNWKEDCRNYQKKLGISKPLIITSMGNLNRLSLTTIFNSNSIFSSVEPNPTFEDCNALIDFCKKSSFDGVVSIGGGSVMDAAKVAMAFLSTRVNKIHELLNITSSYEEKINSIFIPTTHGTGSEVTMWGTIWNMKEKKKYSISHKYLYPSVAILDGNLTVSLPLDISVITTMDALSHCFESIWNKNANPTSTDYAIKGICSILINAPILKENPSDVRIRKNLLKASNQAGLAFSNTKTAAAHSISYPLTIYYGIPHGIASSISLIPLLEINKNFITEQINKICEKIQLTFDQLKQRISSIYQGIIPFTLESWDVPKSQLEFLLKHSFTKDRMENNIINLKKSDIKNILNKIYE